MRNKILQQIWIVSIFTVISLYVYIILTCLYIQFIGVMKLDNEKFSTLEYFLKDNIGVITISVLICLIILINSINAIHYWLEQRRKEIRVMKVVGGDYKKIKKIILNNISFLVLLGILLGICVGSIIIWILNISIYIIPMVIAIIILYMLCIIVSMIIVNIILKDCLNEDKEDN